MPPWTLTPWTNCWFLNWKAWPFGKIDRTNRCYWWKLNWVASNLGKLLLLDPIPTEIKSGGVGWIIQRFHDGAAEVAKNISMQVASMELLLFLTKILTLPSFTSGKLEHVSPQSGRIMKNWNVLKAKPSKMFNLHFRAQLTDAVIADAEAAIKAELKAEGKTRADLG